MIDPNAFSKAKAVIKPADLGGANVAVVTVEHAEQIEIGGDPKIVMQFEEFPEVPNDKQAPRNYFPNLTSIRNLVDALGADESKWKGKQVVLEVVKTNDPNKKRQVDALWVAAAETWGEHIRAAGKRTAPRPASTAGNSSSSSRSNAGASSATKKTTSTRR